MKTIALTYIYALRDPRDKQVHYIGKANQPDARLLEHMTDKGANPQKAAWIGGLVACGLKPELEILETVARKDWPEAERRWIVFGRQSGWPLTNVNAGGAGGMSAGETQKDEWLEILGWYLPPEDNLLLATLTKDQRAYIAWQVAMKMGDYMWTTIERRGGDPHRDFNVDKKFWMGSLRAIELVRDMAAST